MVSGDTRCTVRRPLSNVEKALSKNKMSNIVNCDFRFFSGGLQLYFLMCGPYICCQREQVDECK